MRLFGRIEYKWVVGIVFVFGLFMDLLDMTIVNVALPTFAREFKATPTTIEWVVTGYLLSLAVFIPFSGWAGDRFGTKRTFMFALSVFVLSSFLCAISGSIEQLIAFRVMQGIGGGMLTPVGTAMLYRAFPPAERASASAILAIPAVVAPATGPVLGGYLVQYQSWHWIFLVNIPIGLTGLLVAFLVLREEKQARPGRLDIPGFFLSATSLATVVYALAEAGPHGFGATKVVAFGGIGLALLGLFIATELRTAEPMIDVRLLSNKLFRGANVVNLLGFAGFNGAMFLLPLLLQAERGLDAFEAGLTTFPQALGVVMMVRPASHIYRRFGPRRMLMAGMIGAAISTFLFLFVDLETDLWWIRVIMLARGWSFAIMLIPLQTATFATIGPQDTGRASAVFNANRQVAASFGVALLATALTNRLAHHAAQLGNPLTQAGAVSAFHDAFFVGAVLCLVGMAAAFVFIDDREAAATMAHRPAGAAAAEEAVAVAS